MRKSIMIPLSAVAFVAACSGSSSRVSEDMLRDLELAQAETPELAGAGFAQQQVISAQELAPYTAPEPAPAPRRAPSPTRAPVRTPAPVANAESPGSADATEDVAYVPVAPEPSPEPPQAPEPEPIVAERPAAPPIINPDAGSGARGGRGGGGVVVVIRGGRGSPDHCPPPGRRGRGGGIVIGTGRGGPGILINDRVPRSGPSVSVPVGGGRSIGIGFP